MSTSPSSRRLIPAEVAGTLLAVVGEDVASALSRDPIDLIPDMFGLEVQIRPVDLEVECPVYGQYSYEDRQIVVGEALSQGRMSFTALHELGHHLLGEHDIYYDILESDDPEALEEEVCDAFAGQILLPDHLVEATIDPRGPTAQGVLDLFDRSSASRAACAVRAAQKIRGSGLVMVAGLNRVAQFTAGKGTFRIAKGTPQDNDGPIGKAAERGRYSGEGTVTYRSGRRSDRFLVDAVARDGYVLGVFVSNDAPWGGLSITTDDGPTVIEHECEHCGTAFTAYRRHSCGVPQCPECGRCACEGARTARAVCRRCQLEKLAHLMGDNGICVDCE